MQLWWFSKLKLCEIFLTPRTCKDPRTCHNLWGKFIAVFITDRGIYRLGILMVLAFRLEHQTTRKEKIPQGA